jgi:hypothetical protein
MPLAGFCLCHTPGSAGQDEACNSFEFVGIQPGSVLVTPIDDHTGALAEIAPSHHRVASGTATIFDTIACGVSAIDSRHGRLPGLGSLTGNRSRTIDKRREYVFGGPQAVAFGAFLNHEAADFAGAHPTFATGAAKLRRGLERNLRLESDPARQTETGVIEIAGHAFRADQASASWCRDDARLAVVADFVAFPRDRATGATALDRCVDTDWRRRLERRPTATIEGAPRHHRCHIVLRMTICTGDQFHAVCIG